MGLAYKMTELGLAARITWQGGATEAVWLGLPSKRMVSPTKQQWSGLANKIIWIELADKMTMIGLSNDRYLMSGQKLAFPISQSSSSFPQSLVNVFFLGGGLGG